MSEPKPWSEEPGGAPPEVVQAVRLAASVPPRQLDRASWDDVLARAARPQRDWRLVPAFFASVLAGVLLVLLVQSADAPAPTASVAHVAPVVTPTPGASFTQETAERIALRTGSLRIAVPRGGSVHVQTPHLEVDTQRGRFLAEVTATGTRVSVEEGEVVVRTARGEQVLKAGESATYPPTPDIPSSLLVQPESAPSCNDGTEAQRLDCLSQEAQRDGLEAQAALYEWGTLEGRAGHGEQAERAFRTSLARFPEGVLHPEVRLALLVELVRARRFAEAEAVAEEFERTCADDPRLADVAELRRNLAAQRTSSP